LEKKKREGEGCWHAAWKPLGGGEEDGEVRRGGRDRSKEITWPFLIHLYRSLFTDRSLIEKRKKEKNSGKKENGTGRPKSCEWRNASLFFPTPVSSGEGKEGKKPQKKESTLRW